MNYGTIVGVVLSCGSCLSCQADSAVDQRTGVIITSQVDPSAFPAEWKEERIGAEAMPLDPERAVWARGAIMLALRTYPTILLQKHLSFVYVTGKLYFYGGIVAGTNYDSSVFINCSSLRITSFRIQQRFHHEFSSLLFKSNEMLFDNNRWARANPIGFHYSGDPERPEPESNDQMFVSEYEGIHGDGFLLKYSMTSMENDFNVVAEQLFSGIPEFWDLVARYPRIKQKVGIAIEFYRKQAPEMTEEFFRGYHMAK